LVGSNETGEDSENLLDEFLGKSNKGRDQLVLEATSRTAFRKGNWAMIPPYKGPALIKSVNIEIGNSEEFQLYDLEQDPGQRENLAQSNPEKLQELVADFERIRGIGTGKIEDLELK
jgi:arylsulfatase A-like enzyme